MRESRRAAPAAREPGAPPGPGGGGAPDAPDDGPQAWKRSREPTFGNADRPPATKKGERRASPPLAAFSCSPRTPCRRGCLGFASRRCRRLVSCPWMPRGAPSARALLTCLAGGQNPRRGPHNLYKPPSWPGHADPAAAERAFVSIPDAAERRVARLRDVGLDLVATNSGFYGAGHVPTAEAGLLALRRGVPVGRRGQARGMGQALEGAGGDRHRHRNICRGAVHSSVH